MANNLQIEDGERRKQNNLQDRIDCHQYSAIISVTIRKIIPD
jgi:hypothetical protein